MKYQDIVKKTDKELTTLLSDARKQLSQELIDMRTKQVKNVKQVQAHKKTIARVLTLQQERTLSKEETNG